MKSSLALILLIASAIVASAAGAAWAQDEEGTTPGAIPDPSTYQGSTQLQQQSDQQDQQFRQQQQQQEPYSQPAYSTPGPSYGSAPRRGPSRGARGARAGYASGAPASAPAARSGRITFKVGASAQGSFTPLSGAHLWIVVGDPVRALIAAGIEPIGSSLAQITYDCHVAWVCVRDFKAMTTKAVGVYTTDASGHAQAGPLSPGVYFVIGYAALKGGTLVWSEPLVVQAGDNTVTLDQTDGSAIP